jgi:metallo-beta-lactamase family protein
MKRDMDGDSPGPTLTFLGAVGTVTGSRFLVQAGAGRVLVDAGLYQGVTSLRRRNWTPFPVSPASLDTVVLTHAHLDHCGYLPRLVNEGFRGRVVCTQDTADLAAIVLRDSAHIQEEDARWANEGGWSKHRPALPLYDSGDVEATLRLFDPVEFGDRVRLVDSVEATLLPAGHILGSSIAVLDSDAHCLAFSGDLGRPGHPLLRPPAPPPAVGTLVVESTYGDRRHPVPDPEVLAGAVRRTVARGGTVLVPAFAVDRTELVLLELQRLSDLGQIPRVPVYVDSPMALAALDVYRRAARHPSAQLRGEPKDLLDDLDHLDLHAVHDPARSRELNEPEHPCIIVSASGMATGGRIVHHLAHQVADRRNCVVLTGYQAEGTRGRQLLEGERHLKMYGHYVPVRAEVVQVPDFSVHADADELVAWVASAEKPPHAVYVVHGEATAGAALARRLEAELGLCAIVPREGERVLLD